MKILRSSTLAALVALTGTWLHPSTCRAGVQVDSGECIFYPLRGAFAASGRDLTIGQYDFMWESSMRDGIKILNGKTLSYDDFIHGVAVDVSFPSIGLTLHAYMHTRHSGVVDLWWLDDPEQRADAAPFLVPDPKRLTITVAPEGVGPVPDMVRAARAAKEAADR